MPDPTSPAGATPEAGATPAGVATAVEAPAATTGTDDLGEGGRSALAALRQELKAVKAERDEFATAKREADDADRTELEKATRDRDEAVTAKSSLELQVLKMQAAIEAGIPKHWQRLNGKDADELATDAAEFAKSFRESEEEEQETAGPGALGAGPRTPAPATGRAAFNDAIRRKAHR